MLSTIIIFFIAIIVAFSMLLFRSWELRTDKVKIPENMESTLPDLSFRHVEKSMLYLTKHILQGAVLVIVKYWFIFVTKTKKWINERWPKVNSIFKKGQDQVETNKKPSFLKKAILESEAKIKRIKEKVKREHE